MVNHITYLDIILLVPKSPNIQNTELSFWSDFCCAVLVIPNDQVFIIESGRLCYLPGGKGEVEVAEGEVLCLPTLWAVPWRVKKVDHGEFFSKSAGVSHKTSQHGDSTCFFASSDGLALNGAIMEGV